MRPTHKVPGKGELREITMWKAIVLSIVTLGIYYLILVYQNTKDVQDARDKPFGLWQVFFWVGIIVVPLQWINYGMNGIGLAELRKSTNQGDSPIWIVALVLTLVIVGPFIWAMHYNDSVRTAARGQRTPAPTQVATATA